MWSHALKADDKTIISNILTILIRFDCRKMKEEEPPKKPDGEGGGGIEEEDHDQPIPMDDEAEAGNVEEEDEDELDDLTAEGKLYPRMFMSCSQVKELIK